MARDDEAVWRAAGFPSRWWAYRHLYLMIRRMPPWKRKVGLAGARLLCWAWTVRDWLRQVVGCGDR